MRIANLESPEFSNLTHIAQNGKNEKEYNELIEKTKEARRQKQLETLKNFKINNKQIIQSKDKER